jgi:hypothetical protein
MNHFHPGIKKAKKEYLFNGVKLDSAEELEFAMWLDEATKAGLVLTSEYHPEPFEIIPTFFVEDPKRRCLFRAHTYGVDWILTLSSKFYQLFPNVFQFASTPFDKVYLDIKGANPRMISESDHTFRINQKLVYDKYKIYVHKTILCDYKVGKNMRPGFFAKTFCPQQAMFMKNRRVLTVRKNYSNCKLINQLINN